MYAQCLGDSLPCCPVSAHLGDDVWILPLPLVYRFGLPTFDAPSRADNDSVINNAIQACYVCDGHACSVETHAPAL